MRLHTLLRLILIKVSCSPSLTSFQVVNLATSSRNTQVPKRQRTKPPTSGFGGDSHVRLLAQGMMEMRSHEMENKHLPAACRS